MTIKVSNRFLKDFAQLCNHFNWTLEEIEEFKIVIRENPEMKRYLEIQPLVIPHLSLRLVLASLFLLFARLFQAKPCPLKERHKFHSLFNSNLIA